MNPGWGRIVGKRAWAAGPVRVEVERNETALVILEDLRARLIGGCVDDVAKIIWQLPAEIVALVVAVRTRCQPC